jgi:TPR repeat protein
VLERAADTGDAAAALALAATYDPAVLARHKVKGLVPDNAKAAHWYERARDLGSQEAPLRLNALARGN